MSSEDNNTDSGYALLKFGAFVVVVGVIWLFLRNNTQSQLNTFNTCQDRAFSSADKVTNEVANSGLYSTSEVNNANFEAVDSGLNACWQTVPPPSNIMMLITGVTGSTQ